MTRLGTSQGLWEYAEGLPRSGASATAQQEENLPEMGGILGLCPCPTALACQSLASPKMNVAFVPSAASEGFQATTSSQVAPPGPLRLGTEMTKLPEVLPTPRGAVHWPRARRGRPAAAPSVTRTLRVPSVVAVSTRRTRAPAEPERTHLGQRLLLFGAQVSDPAAHPGSALGRGGCGS